MDIIEELNNVDECDVHDDVGNNGETFKGDYTTPDPTEGMSFAFEEDVKSFYASYVSRKCFGWKIRTSKKTYDGKVNYIILACSREGNRKSSISTTLKTLPTRVKNYKVKLTTKLEDDGRWYIRTVIDDHSHNLSPKKARLFPVNRNMDIHVKRTIQINDDAGVRINKTFRSLVVDAGGYDSLSFVEKDVRNYVLKERRAIGKEGDDKALINYFHRMQMQNSNFFYDMDLDDDFRVKNVFWADARSRATYEPFGDVVTFDTTYLINKYDMSFAAFVCVNHHGQSVLLGCGLLSSEDTSSFVWLFESWLRCMSGKSPNGIVTNQCKAMRNAIQLVFPSTRHRWCLWHIMKKIPKKLKGYFEYKKIKSAMKVAIYDTFTVEEFKEKWGNFIKKFELEENVWLSDLFKERSKWVPIFLKKDFWAGMSTTQQSESIHAFFDDNAAIYDTFTSLQHFVQQYDNALRDKAEKEVEFDFQSMNTTIPCGSSSSIEKQFQVEYTHAKFREVQYEFRGKMNCGASLRYVQDLIATYDVLEEISLGDWTKECIFQVVFNRDNHEDYITKTQNRQNGMNLCIKSSVEVFTGGDFNHSSTMGVADLSFTDLLVSSNPSKFEKHAGGP